MPHWIAACTTDAIDPEDVVPFDHAGHSYAVYRSPEDAYYATDGYCTHARASLCDGLVTAGTVECPKHGGRFDYTTGKALDPPAFIDVRTYPTKVEDGTVYIDVA